jgi:ATP/maltotriose-dependent transcriptional regulator MalT
VPRPRLLERLSDDEGRRLVVVCAPPGSGKTTLLAAWHAAQRGRRGFAWLSLDRFDNDPVRFWTGVLEAVRSVTGPFGAGAESVLRAPNTSLVGEVVPLVLAELSSVGQPLVIALDDYHEIREPAVHASVTALLDRLPGSVELAIASRTDPPLPLARLRVRHELTEIRAAELGFDAREAGDLLNARHGLALDPEHVARLTERTEGWAAGLQLAALSLRGREDGAAFIDTFAGDDRQVVDYLAFEVLDTLDDDTRAFLLQTAVLDRMCGPLCDAVTGGTGSAERLEELMRASLFVVALDERARWYRYHHLFRDLLRHELRRTQAARVAGLHRRAYRWLEAEGLPVEAIGHALEAGDAAHAAGLVDRTWLEYFNRGYLATVRGWLDSLPPDARPWLPRAWTALDRGDLAAAAPLLEEPLPEDLLPWRELLRALHAFKGGDVAGAATRMSALRPAPSRFWESVARSVRGVCDYWSGRTAEARDGFAEASRLAEADGNPLGALYARGYLALLAADERDWPAVERHVSQARALEDAEPAVREHFALMALRLAEGRLHRHGGRAAAADAALSRAVALARRGAGRPELLAALLALADCRRAAGDLQSAQALTVEARDTLRACIDPAVHGAAVEAAERRLQLGQLHASKPAAGVGDALSSRELAVLRMLPTGLSQREIGDRLFVSVNTVKTHVRAIYRKLNAPTRQAAVDRARELGLV